MFADWLGNWAGTSRLYLEGAAGPCEESASAMVVSAGVHERFVELRYEWAYKGAAQRGLMVMSAHKGESTAAWCDSWHQNSSVMHLAGTPSDVKGSYSVPGHPDWHWRITLKCDGDKLHMIMYNVSPEGEEYLAVQAEYGR